MRLTCIHPSFHRTYPLQDHSRTAFKMNENVSGFGPVENMDKSYLVYKTLVQNEDILKPNVDFDYDGNMCTVQYISKLSPMPPGRPNLSTEEEGSIKKLACKSSPGNSTSWALSKTGKLRK